jgi:uridine kinase
MDNYYKNTHLEDFDNYDHPSAFDTTLLYENLNNFLQTNTVKQYEYNFYKKDRHLKQIHKNIDIVILEGLYAFYENRIKVLCTCKLYIDINSDIRIKRRLLRDKKERNISISKNMEMINNFVHKMHKEYVSKQKEYADLNYKQNDHINKIIKLLNTAIDQN